VDPTPGIWLQQCWGRVCRQGVGVVIDIVLLVTRISSTPAPTARVLCCRKERVGWALVVSLCHSSFWVYYQASTPEHTALSIHMTATTMRPTATAAATNHTAAPPAAAIAKIASWIEHEQCCVTTQRVSQHWNVSRKRAAEWLEEIVSSNHHNSDGNNKTDGNKKYRLTFCQHQQQQQQQPNYTNEEEEEVPMTSECVLVGCVMLFVVLSIGWMLVGLLTC
jgi:hypothetical protein